MLKGLEGLEDSADLLLGPGQEEGYVGLQAHPGQILEGLMELLDVQE